MKDYFAVLGLDRDASEETIKSTYRRLARETHPDRFRNGDAAGQAEAGARMAELNEAYATLSDSVRRKEHVLCIRAERAVAEAVSTSPGSPVELSLEETWTPARSRARAGSGVVSCVVSQYGMSALGDLLSQKGDVPWQTRTWEGFDWALESATWFTRYHVAFRGFTTLGPEGARKFINYALYAMEQSPTFFRKRQFGFLLAFQRVHHGDQTMVMLRRFAETHQHRAMVALLDVHRPRVMLCGPSIHNARFDKLMACFAAAR